MARKVIRFFFVRLRPISLPRLRLRLRLRLIIRLRLRLSLRLRLRLSLGLGLGYLKLGNITHNSVMSE